MESTMVIKVKYGNTLRRFNARIDEFAQLDLNIDGLRSKILGLFNCPPDADITMTYVDEDGDVVTLVEDEDLKDVMRQRLKFLRIDVQVSGEKGASHVTQSSTPLISPPVQNSLPNINASVSEPLKSMEKQLKEAVAKLSVDLESLRSPRVQSSLPNISASVSEALKLVENTTSKIPVVPAFRGSTSKTVKEAGIGGVTKAVGSAAFPAPLVDSSLSDNCKKETKKHENVRDGKFEFLSVVEAQCCPAPKPYPTAGVSLTASSDCPFSSLAEETNSTLTPIHHGLYPYKRTLSNKGVMGDMIHKGIVCDGCDVHPITGPRYKSTLRSNYDLCSTCFAKMGKEGDYIRMDRPVNYRHPRICKDIHDHAKKVLGGSLPHVSRKCGSRSHHPKLDSHFIADLTIMDGTLMAPSTPFTKIWRMHNNGNSAWPRGTQIIWIGGDKLTDALSVELEVPESGVPSDGNIDIAVDFTAPKLPGSYISYWRMTSSSGYRFGQRVWVHIQVDASLQDSVCDSLGGINLNLPRALSEEVEGNVKAVVDGGLLDSTSSKSIVLERAEQEQDLKFPINDALIVGQGASAPPEPTSHVSYPIIDVAETSRPGPSSSSVTYPLVDSSPVTLDVKEQTLLKELEDMGFKQVDLNKEILRKNEYNLEQSVDQLCGVEEWDPMLEELEEMGFCDTEMNKRLLEKNNGSIKRVVMDLINGHNNA